MTIWMTVINGDHDQIDKIKQEVNTTTDGRTAK